MKNNAILLCGGIGRRMAPISRCNKSLLNIRGEMNLKRIVKILYNQGIQEIILATNPVSAEDLLIPCLELTNELPELSLITVPAKDYVEGCNNVVTMKSVSEYIRSSYIIETDQYYDEEVLKRIITSNSQEVSYIFTQMRGEEDWAVLSDENKVVWSILQGNPDNLYPCLSGIIYVNEDLAYDLRKRLANCEDKDIYWEELLRISDQAPIVEKYFPGGYAIEYDNLSDLINNKLMTSQEIADLVDDNHSAERLGSMTNTTYKVVKGGVTYALRIPGYGTDRFINHHRERGMESTIPLDLRPDSLYFSDDEVKLSQYLEGYSVLKDFKDISKVIKALSLIHNRYLDCESAPHMIDLMAEISDYEDIYSGRIPYYGGYEKYKSIIADYLENWFATHPHERVHRDLVPLNIMINDEGDVKFIDWEYSGYLSKYWDLASFICEYADEYGVPLYEVFQEVVASYPTNINQNDLMIWIAIVDFVWSAWSLAKVVLGDDVLKYGQRRYDRSIDILNKYYRK